MLKFNGERNFSRRQVLLCPPKCLAGYFIHKFQSTNRHGQISWSFAKCFVGWLFGLQVSCFDNCSVCYTYMPTYVEVMSCVMSMCHDENNYIWWGCTEEKWLAVQVISGLSSNQPIRLTSTNCNISTYLKFGSCGNASSHG